VSYTSVFGGNTIYPSDVSYLSLALTADTPLEWPLESSGTEDPAARIIDVDPDASGRSIVLPDATLTGAGQTILFNNIDPTYSFFVKDYAGNTLATVTAGTQWQVYLAATTTAAGTWRVFRYGASTATVQPSALAGFGLTVTGSTLSQTLPVTTFSTTGLTVATSSRASAFVWTGTGAGTLSLLTAASAGNNFFVLARNEGGGDLTIDPSGTETINNGPTLVLRPGDSCTVITDGVEWYTIGLGQEAVFAFDYTSVSVTGGTVTLSGSQLNRIAYKFVGTLTSNCTIVVPSTIQQYWVNNATTGAFTLFVKTSAGSPAQVNQGAKGIYYCDGTNMVLASDPTTLTTPIVISDGGTGATTASGARLNIGISSFADAIVTATTGASVRTTIGAAASGVNGDITSLTGLTTALSIAQGGTAATTAGAARTSLGAAASGANGDITSLTGLTTPLSIAQGGTAATTASAARTSLGATTVGSDVFTAATASAARTAIGATTVGANVFTLTNPSAITFPRFNADNTVSALDAATFRTAIGAGTGTVTSVGGTGSVNGLTLTGTVTSSGSLTLGGSISSVATGATIDGVVIGFRNIPRSTTTTTAVAADNGKCIAVSAGITIPSSTFAAGDAISIYNDSGSSITITQGSGLTVRFVGTATTGNRTLAQRGMVTIWFNSATECVISGGGLA
jgi:hypothetical protein